MRPSCAWALGRAVRRRSHSLVLPGPHATGRAAAAPGGCCAWAQGRPSAADQPGQRRGPGQPAC
eukprot:9150544-Alexandrium_andersonii.AAC.1